MNKYKINVSKGATLFLIVAILVISFLETQGRPQNEAFAGEKNMNNGFTWDIAPFGDLRYWSDETGVLGRELNHDDLMEMPQTAENEWNIGICWDEERDIDRIEITYNSNIPESFLKETKIQYWFQNWPCEGPERQKIEDRLDDPWRGKWVTAETNYHRDGNKIIYTFNPISLTENSNAGNLPVPVDYRRTLKVRIVCNSKPIPFGSLKVISPATGKKVSLRVELGCDKDEEEVITGKLEIFNGWINNVSGWNWDVPDKFEKTDSWKIGLGKKNKGIIADLNIAAPALPGSNDLSIVTLRSSQGTFSFLATDLEKGPIYIPAYSAYISYASDSVVFAGSNIKKGQKIRDRIKAEPEQTYDRASREIPPLSVNVRRRGEKLYLPLASDASWQKFGFEWGGGFFMNKKYTKAKGKEKVRCNWTGDTFNWSVGTGKNPVYDRNDTNSHMSVLNDFLPVPEVRWNHEDLIYHEEAFTTLLEGSLSPCDENRNEQTPAILMAKLDISNPANEEKTAHIWLKGEPFDQAMLHGSSILNKLDGHEYVRAHIKLPEGISSSVIKLIENAVCFPLSIPANQTVSVSFSVPFVGDLTNDYIDKISGLDYFVERQRVISYWRQIVGECVPFNVPERKFNEMARSVIPHIRMSTTKDPMSGLFMVPAAAFYYDVFANESAFQIAYLDKIGDHQTATNYLETFLKLQGTVPLAGTYTGNQNSVFQGVKVSEEYNYTMGDYNLDHGTVLWALGNHYLMTRDSAWLDHAAPNMLRAADWIIEQRNQTKAMNQDGVPELHYGLLPAGHLEDNDDWGFWYAVNAYAYLGLYTTAEAFKMAGLPQADRLEKEAQRYLHDLKNSVKRSSELCPVVRLRDNTYVPFVPSKPYQRFRNFGFIQTGYYSRYGKDAAFDAFLHRFSATREVLYGPMVLITTGIIDPCDPLAEAILDDWEDNLTLSSSLDQNIHGIVDDEYWFSRGGMVFQPNLQNPIQAYLLRNELYAAVRNIYNSMVSCLYPDVNAFTEEFHGWGTGSGPMYKVPDEARFLTRVTDMLILETKDELWLAPGTPKYWLEPGKVISLFNSATSFGNVSYELKYGTRHNTIEASINLPGKISGKIVKLFVHAPFEKPIKSVLLNGEVWNNWDRNREIIVLPTREKTIHVQVFYNEK